MRYYDVVKFCELNTFIAAAVWFCAVSVVVVPPKRGSSLGVIYTKENYILLLSLGQGFR